MFSFDKSTSLYLSEWVEFNAPLDTIQVISEAESLYLIIQIVELLRG